MALVVAAAVGLAKGQCKDQLTSALCLMSAICAYYYQAAWLFPLLIAVGGAVTLYAKRNEVRRRKLDPNLESPPVSKVQPNEREICFQLETWFV